MTDTPRASATRAVTTLLRRLAIGRVPKLFDEAYYRQANPDVAASGVDAYLHYVLRGAARNRDPSADFDTAFYRRQSGPTRLDPIRHYLSEGADAGLDPSPAFSTLMYLTRYPDVRQAGTNPLLHYRLNGRAERRIASPSASEPEQWVALSGVPADCRLSYPRDGTPGFSLDLDRRVPLAACRDAAPRICLVLTIDAAEMTALVHTLENFHAGAQDAIGLDIVVAARPHPPKPTLILALEHCYRGRRDDGAILIRYAEARVWDLLLEKPTLKASFPAGGLVVRDLR
jgi:hypothetical protein